LKLSATIGRAEQVAHLAARHAGFHLVDRRLIQEIALLDVDAINAARRGGRKARRQEQGSNIFHQGGAALPND
jgi:hypothetical protein